MENASKALLLAAGILIGLILLSSAVYLYNTIRASQELKSIQLSEEQLLRYNAEFESYDKTRMYGTDVITVLNKAIDNNTKYENDESMFIDVSFKLKSDVKNYVDKYSYVKDTTLNKYVWKKESNKTTTYGGTLSYSLIKNKTYNLKNDGDNDIQQIQNFLDTQVQKSEFRINEKYNPSSSKKESDLEYYEIYYTGFSDFKRKIFECKKIEYKNGKVSAMHFEEIDIS